MRSRNESGGRNEKRQLKTTKQKNNFGLIGHPVGHSLSPFIMNRAFKNAGIDAVYTAINLDEPAFEDALRDFRILGLSGASVTYPYKERVMEIVDRPSHDAGLIGAVNTLKVGPSGVDGFNTDAGGAALALERLGGLTPAGKKALIVGAGGAGRAAGYGLLKAGAAGIVFAVRTPSKTTRFVSALSGVFPDRSAAVVSIDDSDSFDRYDIIINATPAGMAGVDANRNAAAKLSVTPDQLYFDFVYHPNVTPFLERAEKQGAKTLDGLALLVAQARLAFEIWTGCEFSLETMYRDVVEEYARTRKDGKLT